MKIRSWLGIIIFAVSTVLFSAGALIGFQSEKPPQHLTITKVMPSEVLQDATPSGEQSDQDKSIYSRSTFISLAVAVMGIVAFRRNTYH